MPIVTTILDLFYCLEKPSFTFESILQLHELKGCWNIWRNSSLACHMATIFCALINFIHIQQYILVHPYLRVSLTLNTCILGFKSSCIIFLPWFISFSCGCVWGISHRLSSWIHTILSFVPKATATITSHSMTICSNVTNMVACPTPYWVVGTSNTSLIKFMSPCLRLSLMVGICLQIFKYSCIGILTLFTCSS